MKEDEVGRACGTSGRRDMHRGYWRETLRQEKIWKNLAWMVRQN